MDLPDRSSHQLNHAANHPLWLRGRLFLGILLALALLLAAFVGLATWYWDPQQRLNQQLIIASFKGDVAEVNRLLYARADPNGRFGRSGEGVLHYRDGGWPAAGHQWTPLIAIANSEWAVDHVGVARQLVEARAELNLHDGYGATALHRAVYWDREDLALYLLSVGADPNSRVGNYIDGPSGVTALHEAVDNPTLMAALIKAGARVYVVDDAGATALHWAAQRRQVETVKLLLEAGADPMAMDRQGRTPLWHIEWTPERIRQSLFHRQYSMSTDEELRQLAKEYNESMDIERRQIARLLRESAKESQESPLISPD